LSYGLSVSENQLISCRGIQFRQNFLRVFFEMLLARKCSRFQNLSRFILKQSLHLRRTYNASRESTRVFTDARMHFDFAFFQSMQLIPGFSGRPPSLSSAHGRLF